MSARWSKEVAARTIIGDRPAYLSLSSIFQFAVEFVRHHEQALTQQKRS